MKKPRIRAANAGYGLVVIAALFTAFAVVAAAMLDRNNALVELNRQQAARTQLSRLTLALAKYARYNSNRYPCPASRNLAYSNGSFGSPAAATCYSGAAPAGTTLVTGTTTASKSIFGMVPVRVLVPYGISITDAYDPWNVSILYIVHRDLTPSAPAAAILDGDRPQVTNFNTGTLLYPPDFLLISLGKDKLGGRIRNQANPATTSASCAASTNRNVQNCDGDNTYAIGPIYNSNSAAQSEYFDDTLTMYRQ